ncbi:hypothetical protein V8E53_004549 [Lactarius tabidus]
MTISFVLLRSPLLFPHDSETIIVNQELSAGPPLPEILWNFSRYRGHARITLEQNPHFYLRCPADESTYTPMFRRNPLQDTSGALEDNDTEFWQHLVVEWLLDLQRFVPLFPSGQFLSEVQADIFIDSHGVLEGEQLVRASSTQYHLRYSEELVVSHDADSRFRLNHNSLRPIVTTPLANPSESPDEGFEDWKVLLSHPASNSINMHIYDLRWYPGPARSLEPPPPPPISERPEYQVLYKSRAINTLKDDILLVIFSYYRLENENIWNDWNVRFWWCSPAHVCRRWRQLIFESAFYLGMHIRCTNGTPIVDTLDHLPPLPLFIKYLGEGDTAERGLRPWGAGTGRHVGNEDELGIYHALRLRDRVRHIGLHISPSTLDKSLLLMDKPFPILEHLSLSFAGDDVSSVSSLTLPITLFNQIAFRLPHLSHFLSITEHFTSPKTAEVSFAQNSSIALQHIIMERNLFPNICSALTHALSGVEKLNLTYISSGCAFAPAKLDLQPDEIDGTTWHEFLRSFIGVKELSIDYVLSEGLSRALEVDEIGFDPGLLPGLQELKSRYRGDHSDSIFGSFIHARQVAGRPVSLHLPAP